MSKVGYQASITIVQQIMNGEESQPNKLVSGCFASKRLKEGGRTTSSGGTKELNKNSIHNVNH